MEKQYIKITLEEYKELLLAHHEYLKLCEQLINQQEQPKVKKKTYGFKIK